MNAPAAYTENCVGFKPGRRFGLVRWSISAFLPNLDTTGHERNVAENINNFHEFHGYNNSITNSNEFYGYNSEEWFWSQILYRPTI